TWQDKPRSGISQHVERRMLTIYFQYKYPFDPSDFVHFRKRIGEEYHIPRRPEADRESNQTL
ncbi:MAG: hypothetical protein JXN62_04070, partial [Bacteroidales bacterium]|nr:hypothetical protein [Bacteroidales bacterium]